MLVFNISSIRVAEHSTNCSVSLSMLTLCALKMCLAGCSFTSFASVAGKKSQNLTFSCDFRPDVLTEVLVSKKEG